MVPGYGCGIFRYNVNFFFSIKEKKPIIKINSTVDIENLIVRINWDVNSSIGEQFQPEKMILMYSENNQSYRLVNKYRKLILIYLF